MAEKTTNYEVKNAKRSGRTGGFVLGVIATLAGGVLIKETCNKNIVDGADKAFKAGTKKVKSIIGNRKAKKEAEKIEAQKSE